MKRVRCPKCDTFIVFDESKYDEGQSLVFECTRCKKKFKIRIGTSHLTDIHQERHLDDAASNCDYGSITVVENKFAFKQVLPLKLGNNEFGRYLKGTDINQPIETSDSSVDTFHCAIRVERNKQGELKYILRDAPSHTGTFHQNQILRDQDRINLNDGDIITIGATTLIFCKANTNG